MSLSNKNDDHYSLKQITIPAEDRRDDEQLYHKYHLKHLKKIAPFVDWISYFNFAFRQINHTITEDEPIVVYSPAYLSNVSNLIQEYNSTPEGRVYVLYFQNRFTSSLLILYQFVCDIASSFETPFIPQFRLVIKLRDPSDQVAIRFIPFFNFHYWRQLLFYVLEG